MTASQATATAAAVALAAADPVLGLVAILSAAWNRLEEALEHTTCFEPHPLVDKAHRDIDAAVAALLATPPMTLAGAGAQSRGSSNTTRTIVR